jgi:hypothetical protein
MMHVVRLVGTVRGSRNLLRLTLVFYGIILVVAVVAVLAMQLPGHTFIGTREDGVRASIEAMARGAPSLTGYLPANEAGGQPVTYPIGITDDEGIYLVLPWLARAIDVKDPTVLLMIFTLGMMGSVIVLYPVLLFELFDSFVVGVLGPIALLTQFRALLSSDIYWIPAWTVLALLPFVLIACRHWSRSAILTLGIVLSIASFASSIRSHSGLPILMAVVALVLLKERRWRTRALLALSLVVIYFSIGPGIVGGARSLRDAQLGTDWARSSLASHPFWHPAYLGLGYLPNPYGIRWDDTVAAEAVQREDPSAGYVTPEYEASLRRQYFAILQRDPGFVVATYAAKGAQLVQDLLSRYFPLVLLVPLSVVVGFRRKRMRILVLLTLPALVMNAIPPLVAVPELAFEHGWLAGGALLWLLGIGWAIVEAPAAAVWVRRGTSTAIRWWRNPTIVTQWLGRNVRLVLVVTVVVVAAGYGASLVNEGLERVQTTKTYRENSAQLGPAQTVGQPIKQWILKELPGDWWRNPGATSTTTSEGVAVSTTAEKFTYQLMSPVVNLAPGAYQLTVKARPNSGGITIGVLDANRSSWVVTRNYSAIQGGFDEGTMVAKFRVTDAVRVQIVLANWSPSGHRSAWLLHEAGVFSAPD